LAACLSFVVARIFTAMSANFTKDQVLLSAGTTVLANANQTSQLVLGLLK
jgi:flagellin-like hook-associated protein FlgL